MTVRVIGPIYPMDPRDHPVIVDGENVGGFPDLKKQSDATKKQTDTNTNNIQVLKEAREASSVIIHINEPTSNVVWENRSSNEYAIYGEKYGPTLHFSVPNPTDGIPNGATLLLTNNSSTGVFTVGADSPGPTVDGYHSFNLSHESFAKFRYSKSDNDFKLIQTGYSAPSKVMLLSDIKKELQGYLHTDADLVNDGFLKGIKMSGDGSPTVTPATWLHFNGASVAPSRKTGQVEVDINFPHYDQIEGIPEIPKIQPAYLAYLDKTAEVPHSSDDSLLTEMARLKFKDKIHMDESGHIVENSDGSLTLKPIAGKTKFLIAMQMNVSMPIAPNTYCRVFIRDESETPMELLKDIGGNLMAEQRLAGNKGNVGPILVHGIVEVSKPTKISFGAMTDDAKSAYAIVHKYHRSGVLVQALTDTDKTSTALLQFEQDTGHLLNLHSKYVGNILSIEDVYSQRGGYGLRSGISAPIFHAPSARFDVSAWSSISMSYQPDRLIMTPNNNEPLKWVIRGTIYPPMLDYVRGRDLEISLGIRDKHKGYKVVVFSSMDVPDYTSAFNEADGQFTLKSGFTELATFDIPIDPEDEYHNSFVYHVPADLQVKHLYVALHADTSSTSKDQITDFTVGVTEPFTEFWFENSELIDEARLIHSTSYRKFSQSIYPEVQEYPYRLAYRIDTKPVPLPLGISVSGAAPVELNKERAETDHPDDYDGIGSMKFTKDGIASWTSTLNVYSGQTDSPVELNFWWEKYNADGTATKIPDSNTVASITPLGHTTVTSQPFSLEVKAGDEFRIHAKANAGSIIGIESNSKAKPSISTSVHFEDYASLAPEEDPWKDFDELQADSRFSHSRFLRFHLDNTKSKTLPFRMPTQYRLAAISASTYASADGSGPETSLSDYSWVYDPDKSELTITLDKAYPTATVTFGIFY